LKKIIIAAISQNGIIGNNNKIPWYSKEELQHFKKTTSGYPIIMGRKTYETLGKPLPNRLNIVITKNEKYKQKFKNVLLFHSLGKAYRYLRKEKYTKVFICGGASIYNIAIRNADELIISIMKFNAGGNKSFPKINPRRWKLKNKINHKEFTVYYYVKLYSVTTKLTKNLISGS